MTSVIRFRKAYMMYQPGETAGFDDALAKRLVTSGHAVFEGDHQAAETAQAEAAAKAKAEAEAAAKAKAEAEAEAKAKAEAEAAAKRGKT